WYPLSYYQRDPYSRRYRHNDRPSYPGRGGSGGYAGGGRPGGDRPGYPNGGGRAGDGGSGRPGYPGSGDGWPGAGGSAGGAVPGQAGDYKAWRGVTRVPRRDFGNGDGTGRPVDERTARRVIESPPDQDDLPRRIGVPAGAVPSSAGAASGSAGAVPSDGSRVRDGGRGRDGGGRDVVGGPPRAIQFPEASTGAAERRPGVPLDDDLRRSRIFRGREPRAGEPAQSTNDPARPVNRPNAGGSRNPDAPNSGSSNAGSSSAGSSNG